MQLTGVTMVRDEADLIEAFVCHNLQVLDRMFVVDHRSRDGTREILRALVAEGFPSFSKSTTRKLTDRPK